MFDLKPRPFRVQFSSNCSTIVQLCNERKLDDFSINILLTIENYHATLKIISTQYVSKRQVSGESAINQFLSEHPFLETKVSCKEQL